MKKLYTLLTAAIITASTYAQAPNKMTYQAVVRDSGNVLITSTSVGMQLSILQGSVSGPSVYRETQTPTTNINGLVSIEIGSGTVVSGAFTTIDWSAGPYFIKTETDPVGGTNYTITGTSQLMSVPYSLHANTADSIVGGISITEADPVFGASIANGISSADTANWNNHTVDNDWTENGNYTYNVSDSIGIGTSSPSEKLEIDGNIKLSGEIIQKAWIGPTLMNSWINYPFTGWDTTGYYKSKEGVIHFKGIISGGTSNTLFLLPTAYRPSKTKIMLAPYAIGTSKKVGLIYIYSSGLVEFQLTSGTGIPDWISLDNVSFRP